MSDDMSDIKRSLCSDYGSKMLSDFIIVLSITKHEEYWENLADEYGKYSDVVKNIINYTNDYFEGKNNNEEMKKNKKNYTDFIKNWEFSNKFTNEFLSEVTNVFSYNDLYPKLFEANLYLREMLKLPTNMIYLLNQFLKVKNLNLKGNNPGEIKYWKNDNVLNYDLSYTDKEKNTVIEFSKVLENCDEITFWVIYSALVKFKYPVQELSALAQSRINLGY